MSKRVRKGAVGAYDLSKISAPELNSCVLRPRLLEALDAPAPSTLAWVHAPAGAGKTTLALSYAAARKLPLLWYRMDWRDEDLATFFLYFRHAAQTALGMRADGLAPFGPEYAGAVDTYAANFFGRFWQQSVHPFVIVLDNYERLSAAHVLHALLADNATASPPFVRWLVLSRQAPPAHYGGTAVSVIDWPQMRFSLDESRELVKVHGLTDRQRAEQIHANMDGWAAAMVMLAALGAQAREASTHAFAALADQLLDGLPAIERRLFLMLAVLPEFDERAAVYLDSRPDAAHALALFAGRCPLVERLGGAPPRLRFHPLLREHLLGRLRRDTPAADYRALLASAAEYLDATQQFEEAAELHIEGVDWPRLRDLISRRQEALLAAHREATLLRWLGAMPDEFVAADPWLQYWFGVALTIDPARALARLEKAFDGFVLRADSTGALLCFCAAVTSVWAALDDLKPLTIWLERRERIRRELPRCLNPEIRANATAARVVAMSIMTPWEPRLRHLARFGEYALRLLPIRRLQVIVGAPLAHYYAHSGQNAKLFALTGRIAPELDDETLPPLPRIHLQGMVGTAHFIRGDADAVAQYEKCLAIAGRTGVHLVDNVVRAGIVMCLLNRGELTRAEAILEEMRAGTPAHRRFDIGFAHYLTAWLAAIRGDAQLAIEHAQRAKRVFEQIGDAFGVDLGRSILVQVYAEQGLRERAERELEEMRESVARGCQDAVRHLCWLSAAWLALRSGDVQAATESLRAAFALARAQQTIGQMSWRPDVATGLCALAFEHGIEVEYATGLVRHHQLEPPESSAATWPWSIKVYTLGRFTVVRDGASVTFAGKAQRRPLDLLKVLIALGGRDVAQSHVAEALWPQADGDAANASLGMALKRLRELLGHAEAITLTAGKLSINPRICWVDAWTLERGLTRAAGDVGAAERALALYRGAFLGDEEESWSISLRERLRAKFLQGACVIGRELERREHWARAIEFYRRGLDVDDLAEEFYQQLMICHTQLGQRGEALSVYQRCKKSLALRLGVAPTEKTQGLYERLLAS